jgi:large subunit ribosomal protein L25
MKTFEINGSTRTETGKKVAKALRSEGLVPCILYGSEGNVSFNLAADDLRHLVYTNQAYVVELNIDNKKYSAIIKDMQFHPVTDQLLHMDFMSISEDKPFTIQIPITLTGSSEGVKAGGKLSLQMRYLKVSGLRKDLPETLSIDISNLGLGKSILVGELSFPNLVIMNAKSAVIVTVKLTRAARGAAAAEKK